MSTLFRVIATALLILVADIAVASDAIRWQPWSDAVFEQARKEKRFVLLDLEAVWCHWCHVMDEKTYHDEAVMKLIRDHYIAVRVDQDARPDLSRRYEGNTSVVPAAYNAGHGAVDRWIRLRPSMPLDAWIEEIPYGETRRYTRRVLMSQGVYEWLTNAASAARVRQRYSSPPNPPPEPRP